jgi:hypothetical protein
MRECVAEFRLYIAEWLLGFVLDALPVGKRVERYRVTPMICPRCGESIDETLMSVLLHSWQCSSLTIRLDQITVSDELVRKAREVSAMSEAMNIVVNSRAGLFECKP